MRFEIINRLVEIFKDLEARSYRTAPAANRYCCIPDDEDFPLMGSLWFRDQLEMICYLILYPLWEFDDKEIDKSFLKDTMEGCIEDPLYYGFETLVPGPQKTISSRSFQKFVEGIQLLDERPFIDHGSGTPAWFGIGRELMRGKTAVPVNIRAQFWEDFMGFMDNLDTSSGVYEILLMGDDGDKLDDIYTRKYKKLQVEGAPVTRPIPNSMATSFFMWICANQVENLHDNAEFMQLLDDTEHFIDNSEDDRVDSWEIYNEIATLLEAYDDAEWEDDEVGTSWMRWYDEWEGDDLDEDDLDEDEPDHNTMEDDKPDEVTQENHLESQPPVNAPLKNDEALKESDNYSIISDIRSGKVNQSEDIFAIEVSADDDTGWVKDLRFSAGDVLILKRTDKFKNNTDGMICTKSGDWIFGTIQVLENGISIRTHGDDLPPTFYPREDLLDSFSELVMVIKQVKL